MKYDSSLTGGRIAAQYVRKICPEKRPAYEVAPIDAIVAMVAEGLGVSVLPRPRQPLLRADGCREVLGAGAPFRQVAWVYRKADVEDRRHAAVIAALEEAYAALGQSGS